MQICFHFSLIVFNPVDHCKLFCLRSVHKILHHFPCCPCHVHIVAQLGLCIMLLARVDILIADDIVFSQIGPSLHFDQYHGHLTGVLHAVFRAQGDIDRLVF